MHSFDAEHGFLASSTVELLRNIIEHIELMRTTIFHHTVAAQTNGANSIKRIRDPLVKGGNRGIDDGFRIGLAGQLYSTFVAADALDIGITHIVRFGRCDQFLRNHIIAWPIHHFIDEDQQFIMMPLTVTHWPSWNIYEIVAYLSLDNTY